MLQIYLLKNRHPIRLMVYRISKKTKLNPKNQTTLDAMAFLLLLKTVKIMI